MHVEKSYRKQRARLHKKREVAERLELGFFLRMFICLVAFIAFAGVKLRGGETLAWVQNKVEYYMQGAPKLSQAYEESVEAINLLCDRIIEAQNADD